MLQQLCLVNIDDYRKHARNIYFILFYVYFTFILFLVRCVDVLLTLILTAGLAFGGGLYSYRVRGVDGSRAMHLTVESYTVVMLLTVILIIGIPSPTHSFTLGLNPFFSANPPYRTLSFFSFMFHYMDFPDCLLLLLSTSVYLLFSFFCFYTFLVVGSVR